MGKHRRGTTIYVTTNPNVPVEIGTPGVSVSLGPMGPTVYGGSGADPNTTGVLSFLGNPVLSFLPSTIVPTVEF